MILGFKRQFVDAILIGRKRHTIRAGQRWKAGMRADLYQNVSSQNQTLLFRAYVTHVQSITLQPIQEHGRYLLQITINGNQLSRSEAELLAFHDGFEADGTRSALENMAWFWIDRTTPWPLFPDVWKGQIIHWDFARRQL